MADTAEEVLEVEEAVEPVDPDSGDNDQDQEAPELDSEEGETLVAFEGEEEAAPASEDNSSETFAELRKRNRELTRQIRDLSKRAPEEPEPIEVGQRPTLEDCDHEEERFVAEHEAWVQRREMAAAQKAKADEANKAQQAAFAEKVKAYDAEKATLGLANFEEAEAEVSLALPAETMAALMHTEKPATLVAALHRSPVALEKLSKLSLLEAAIMIGELKGRVTVRKGKAKQPDHGIQGKATIRSGDKEIKRLEQEAERTGNRTELIRYRRKLKSQA